MSIYVNVALDLTNYHLKKTGARFVSYADESGDSFFLFYEVIRQNKKGNIMLTLVCIMLLMEFQKGSPFAHYS